MKTKSLLNIALIAGIFLSGACRKTLRTEETLPLPPVGDSGVADGWYVQAEYGFALPVPKGYGVFAPNSDEIAPDDFDEWVRFTDAKHEVVFRIMTQLREAGKAFTTTELRASVGRVFENGEYQVLQEGKPTEWTAGKDRWRMVPYDLEDKVKKVWRTWVCALGRGDYVLWVRVTMPLASAKGPKGEKMPDLLKENLAQVRWYRPVGSRGISLEQYELTQFNRDFLAALESGSVARTLKFFEETSPARFEWSDTYKKLSAPEGKGNTRPAELKAEPAGLVINGKDATAYFLLAKKGAEPQRLGFKLSKPVAHHGEGKSQIKGLGFRP
jgi:hypothetical protein